MVEDFLSTLVARGFTDDGAVAAYRAFSSFLLGHLLLEAAMLGSRTAPAVDIEDAGRSGADTSRTVDLREFPLLRRLEDRLSQDHAAAEFERALEDLLDRLERDLPADLPLAADQESTTGPELSPRCAGGSRPPCRPTPCPAAPAPARRGRRTGSCRSRTASR